ncbi:MAG: macrolide ABC transporter ATP-binding protein [Gammaproteobacteria bacterium RIFCSPLOWO2_02_FULL_42_9]|nr:MAG: macrolide ABC transporter ATP-binding protein [Gammaproteobacteria bacterium RIFCSPLOWO2_02_FULL_42_9]
MNKLIELNNIYKTYHTGKIAFEALKNIDLIIEAGEYAAILGPSGSGKSTLMHILGCLSTPTAGSYLLDNKEVSKFSRNELAKVRNQKIGFVFQSFNLVPQLNIVDNVSLPLVYRSIGLIQRTKRAKEILAQLGLDTHFAHKPGELSGGQQQRAAIARALVTEPDIILADEPTGNLDTQSGAEVIKLFETLSASGKTIIIITHDHSVAERARRIIKIRDGKIE